MFKEVAVAKFVLLARDCPASAKNIASLDTVKFGIAANSADSVCVTFGAGVLCGCRHDQG
jgi:hypothetical protein